MNINKTSILTVSLSLIGAATLIGVANALFGSGSETAFRLGLMSTVLGLGGIGTFFVGWVFPANSSNTTSIGASGEYKNNVVNQ